ncbi:MAG: methyl-accepting chemotaxis protein, partial [Chroococcales cyanobacterium]
IRPEEVENLFNEANQEIDNLVVVLQTENLDQIAQFDGELYSVIDPVTEKIQELIDLQLEVAAQKRTQATEIYSNIRFLFFILLALAVIVASPVGFVLSRKITATLKETISTLANTSSEIAAATEEHERIAEHQAVSVQQTTATMDELSVSSHQSAKQAEVAATGAQTAYSLTEKGTKAVNDTLEEMFQLKENVRVIANQILQLNEQARQIGTISELVSEIANQTNLLALNAAVEAVHAGEHGKGFSVVASEIRKLADQSKQSVEKISTLVTQIQGSVKATMSVADVGQNSVEKGSKIAQNTATTFNEIAEAVQEITVNSQQISHTAKNQAIAIQQVLEAMTQLNRGAVETSSSITQTKVGTETLSKTAKNLTKMV